MFVNFSEVTFRAKCTHSIFLLNNFEYSSSDFCEFLFVFFWKFVKKKYFVLMRKVDLFFVSQANGKKWFKDFLQRRNAVNILPHFSFSF